MPAAAACAPLEAPDCPRPGAKKAGETVEHQTLKALALRWAIRAGFECAGYEIPLPQCGFRADVAAYRPAGETRTIEYAGKTLRQRHATVGATAIFECKQARADLFKDSCQAARAREELARLHTRRQTIERLLRGHYPASVMGDSLFPEYDGFDFTALEHGGHLRIVRKIAALQNAIARKNKFEKMVRYRCANLFYLVTSSHILNHYEVPLSWGLLVQEQGELVLIRKPAWIAAAEGARLAVLQRIAMDRTTINLEKHPGLETARAESAPVAGACP